MLSASVMQIHAITSGQRGAIFSISGANVVSKKNTRSSGMIHDMMDNQLLEM